MDLEGGWNFRINPVTSYCHPDLVYYRKYSNVSKTPGGKYFSKMKAQYSMFVDVVVSKQVCVSIICMTLHYALKQLG